MPPFVNLKIRDGSLRSRLTTLVVVAIFGAVAIVTTSSVWREIGQYSAAKFSELSADANFYASRISDELGDANFGAARKALEPLASMPTIAHVRVLLANGDVVLDLGDGEADNVRAFELDASSAPTLHAFSLLTTNAVLVKAQIVRENQALGWLIVEADTSSLFDRIGRLLWDALTAALFAAGIGLLIALRMQRAVTRPIFALSKVMAEVRETGNFTIRASRESNDEIGDLVDSFNEMLNQVRLRDARLLAHQQNLKQVVKRRTQEVEKAREAAVAANHAKGEFLATMSHEIRTPMNGMLVMAELLKASELPPRQKRYADVIVRSGQSLIAIINDILDFSKIEAGKLELERIPVSPVEIINDVVGLFWERASSKGIDLAAYVGPSTPEKIEGDPVRLNQILSNLVNNALKFTETGEVVVSAKRVVESGSGCVIEFSVSDTGVGIDEDKQATIFQAFSQADQSTTRRFGGTGLGLAICRRLVESMEGTISVRSKKGRGSRFLFRIPARVIEPARAAPEAHPAKRAIIAVSGTATQRILARYLDETGITAQIVGQGSAIVSHMAYSDIIFAAPEFLDAFQKAVKGDPEQWVPARICVSELGDAAPDRLLESGVAEDLLIRPLSRHDVMSQIERIFEGRLRGPNAVRVSSDSAPSLPSFAGARVLAADDSIINREVVQEALTRLGIQPVLVEDGREALEAVKQGGFDLVLMDCSMPVMDGFEATRAIREWEQETGAKPVPILALTAHAAGAYDEWRKAGMNDYVTKPFTIAVLSKALGAWLPERSAGPLAYSVRRAGLASVEALVEDENNILDTEKESPFDFAVLRSLGEMQAGDTDLVARALDLFEEHAHAAALRLVRAVRSGDDPKEIKSSAHALKSMSLNVGARALAKACGAIEAHAASGGDLKVVRTMMPEVRGALTDALSALPSIREEFARRAA